MANIRKYSLFTFHLNLGVTQNVSQYPQHHVTYASNALDVFTNKSLFDPDLRVKVTQNAQYPLYHVTNTPAKFEVPMTNGIGDAFTILKKHYFAF